MLFLKHNSSFFSRIVFILLFSALCFQAGAEFSRHSLEIWLHETPEGHYASACCQQRVSVGSLTVASFASFLSGPDVHKVSTVSSSATSQGAVSLFLGAKMTWLVVGRRVPCQISHRPLVSFHVAEGTWDCCHFLVCWYLSLLQASWVSDGVGGRARPPLNPRSACSSLIHASWCLSYVLTCDSASSSIPEHCHKITTQLLEDEAGLRTRASTHTQCSDTELSGKI